MTKHFTPDAAHVSDTNRTVPLASPISTATLPDSLRRRVEDSVSAMFALQSTAPAFSLEEQLATGVFAPEIEAIRRPASGLDRREGALIEAAVRYALMNSTKYTCRASVPVEIYREAVEVVEANQGGDGVLSVRLPLSGAAAGRVVLDVLAVDRASGVVTLVEVKRSRTGVNDEQIRNLKAATFTVRALLTQQGVPVTSVLPQMIVWWGDPGSDYVTRDSVDEAFGIPIRDLVDAVVRTYRTLVGERIGQLFGTRPRDVAVATQETMATPPVQPFDDNRLDLALTAFDKRSRRPVSART